ncbi:MAG: hypothetical protein V9H69_19320 [Anaerolineae bacterium]
MLPQLWFRNTWIVGATARGRGRSPSARRQQRSCGRRHRRIGGAGVYRRLADAATCSSRENETNTERLFERAQRARAYVKDAFHEYVVAWPDETAVNPEQAGHQGRRPLSTLDRAGRASATTASAAALRRPASAAPFADFDAIFANAAAEADAFYAAVAATTLTTPTQRLRAAPGVGRACCGASSSTHYDVQRWLNGDPGQPPPPAAARAGPQPRLAASLQRRRDLDARQVGVSLVRRLGPGLPLRRRWRMIDPEFAKRQLHAAAAASGTCIPTARLPAYEWDFGDVNPPVHAWAAWRVYQIDAEATRRGRHRLSGARSSTSCCSTSPGGSTARTPTGRNVFQGGFLGLDNIGVFDRSAPLPTGGHIEQADGTGLDGACTA